MVTEPRADATRNRAAVLQAAQTLVERDGAATLRIADVAKAAGVGAGTIYRGFDNKRGLLMALVDDRERALQDAVISGDPPLGPGATPAERLLAFVQALLEHTLTQREILVAADETGPGSRYRVGAYAAWHTHIALLLTQLHPDADAAVLADLVLAPLAPTLFVHLVDERGVTPQTLRAELRRLTLLVAGADR